MPFLSDSEIEILACPICRGLLRQSAQGFTCQGCAASYATSEGVPAFFPWTQRVPDPAWDRWRRKLGLLQEWRAQTWNESPNSRTLQEAAGGLSAEFFRFLRAPERGTVLEIGCGDGGLRRFLPGRSYWGLDPLARQAPLPEDAIFLRGVGERLPMRGECFDTVLLIQTLDHSFDPAAVLAEAGRVLREGGVLGVMQSLRHEPPAVPLRVRVRTALSDLRGRLQGRRRIDDAETKTHPLGSEDVLALVGSLLHIDETARHDHVLFVRALKSVASEHGPQQPEASR